MKSIFFTALSILAIFSIIPALAENLSILEPQVSANAQKVITYIEDSANSGHINPACFFSGLTNVETIIKGKVYKSKVTAESKLKTFQAERKCHVIAEIVTAAKVQTSVLTDQDWKDVSAALARTVKSPVYALLGKEIRKGSVWLEDEKPALAKNKGVSKVETWEIQTDGTVKKIN